MPRARKFTEAQKKSAAVSRAIAWAKENPEKASRNKRNYVLRHPERRKMSSKAYNARKRMEALTHYGGNPPRCACCGESHVEFLSIDHINGGGRRHKKKIVSADSTLGSLVTGFRKDSEFFATTAIKRLEPMPTARTNAKSESPSLTCIRQLPP